MRLIGIIISKCYAAESKPIFLCMSHDVSSFSFVQRNAIKDVTKFLARQIIPKVQIGKREQIAHQEFRLNAMRWSDGLAVCMLTDQDYPARVGFQCLTQVHDDFKKKVPEQLYANVVQDWAANAYKESLRAFVKQFADPRKFDAVTSTQGKVDETKVIMQKNLEQVLGNLQQMESLLEHSEDLSANTHQMFKTSNKLKKGCCQVM